VAHASFGFVLTAMLAIWPLAMTLYLIQPSALRRLDTWFPALLCLALLWVVEWLVATFIGTAVFGAPPRALSGGSVFTLAVLATTTAAALLPGKWLMSRMAPWARR
jgi:cytosine/uracil/thiamine/allantoin permease